MHSRQTIPLVVMLGGMWLLVTARWPAPPPVSAGGSALKAQAGEIVHEVSAIRRLRLTEPIQIELPDHEGMKAENNRHFDSNASDETALVTQALWLAFGFAKASAPDTRTAAAAVRTTERASYAQALRPFYLPETRTLFIPEEWARKDWFTWASSWAPSVAHEAEHALQDQHSALMHHLPPDQKTFDHGLARNAAREGEATLIEIRYGLGVMASAGKCIAAVALVALLVLLGAWWLYRAGKVQLRMGVASSRPSRRRTWLTAAVGLGAVFALLERPLADHLMKWCLVRLARHSPPMEFSIQSNPGLREAPAVVQYQSVFPYRAGLALVVELYEAGGYAVLNRFLAAPPTTTEQVLHPAKYVAGEQAIPVKTPAAPEGMTAKTSGTFGELGLRLVLAQCISPTLAATTAEGWGGDAYTVATSTDGAVTLLWSTVWDTPATAERFARVARDQLRPCWQQPKVAAVGPWRISGDVAIDVKGASVAIVRGVAARNARPLLEALHQLVQPPLPPARPVGELALARSALDR